MARQNRSRNHTSSSSQKVERLRGREFEPDYTYVIKDLRRIAILATSLISVLVILAFFLN